MSGEWGLRNSGYLFPSGFEIFDRLLQVAFGFLDGFLIPNLVEQGFLARLEVIFQLSLALADAVHGHIVEVTFLHGVKVGNFDFQALWQILLLLEEFHDAGTTV